MGKEFAHVMLLRRMPPSFSLQICFYCVLFKKELWTSCHLQCAHIQLIYQYQDY